MLHALFYFSDNSCPFPDQQLAASRLKGTVKLVTKRNQMNFGSHHPVGDLVAPQM